MILRTSLVLSLCSVAALAQTNRSVTLGVAPGLGVTSTYTAAYPTSAAGRFGFFLLRWKSAPSGRAISAAKNSPSFWPVIRRITSPTRWPWLSAW